MALSSEIEREIIIASQNLAVVCPDLIEYPLAPIEERLESSDNLRRRAEITKLKLMFGDLDGEGLQISRFIGDLPIYQPKR